MEGNGEGGMVLPRRPGADGRPRAYLNGRSANVADLRDLGGRLLSFYGQHEHRKLTLAGAQLQILDAICGAAQKGRLEPCAGAPPRPRALALRLEELGGLAAPRERELGLLEFELGEIDALAPDPAEHERLLLARERLRRADALQAAAASGAEALVADAGDARGATELLAVAAASLEDVAGVDPIPDRLGERMRAAAIESQELAGELRDYRPGGPVKEIASGGELSLVMLAIMSAASAAAPETTLVFDEVDAGIGGRTANAVGARLQELGERGQVICITHLPQIASLGSRHFSIVKDTAADPTRASVVELAEAEVVSELVRMLGADGGDGAARRHARELLVPSRVRRAA